MSDDESSEGSLKVVQVVSSFSHSIGGLFVSVSHLVRSSLAEGEEVYVFGPTGDETLEDMRAWEPAIVERFPRIGPRKFGYGRGLVRRIQEVAPDVVHAHGLWTYPSVAAARWSRRAKRPYMISVHGMAEKWALQQSATKKRFALGAYQDRLMREACLRATSVMEVESIRAAGFDTPVALIPNGIDLPRRAQRDERTNGRALKRALFLSRLHPKKGVLNLVEAWKRVAPERWELVIVGPDEKGYERQILEAIRSARLTKSIKVIGPVWGEERFRYYWDADLFVLPSFSENFGLVIAEALACEVPVITTRGLPWQELEDYACGWWIDIGVEALVVALRNALALPNEQLRQMGRSGRELIRKNYTWKVAGQRLSETYRWMLGFAPRPFFVSVKG